MPTGLPIGYLTSQWLANLYLDGLDHFVTSRLGFGGYVRYAYAAGTIDLRTVDQRIAAWARACDQREQPRIDREAPAGFEWFRYAIPTH